MLKKLFVVLAGLFIIVLFLWGIYALFFATSNSLRTTSDDDGKDETLDLGEKDQRNDDAAVEVLSDHAVVSPTINDDGTLITYFEKNTGFIWAIDPETKQRTLVVEKEMNPPIAAVWPTGKQNPILKTSSSDGARYWFYDTRAGDATPLKAGIQYLVWDSLSERIIYTYRDEAGKKSFNIANPNGTNWRTIGALTKDRVILATVPKSPYISFWEPPQNTRVSSLFTLNITGGEPNLIFSGKSGADYLWSPSGDKVLVSFAPEKSGSKTLLAVMNKFGGEFFNLNSPTFVSKCVWAKDSKNVYCALPTTIPQGAIMPDDYMSGKVRTADTFWKIDTENGKSERAVDLNSIPGSYDASEMFLSLEEDLLFFVNKKDGLLYKLRLIK